MFEKPHRPEVRIGLTPLIDVVFILLIFVILAANFDRIKGLKVALPKASTKQVAPTKTLQITITEAGKLYLGEKAIQETQLLPQLRILRKKHKTLLLKAASKVALQRAVLVLDTASNAGFFFCFHCNPTTQSLRCS